MAEQQELAFKVFIALQAASCPQVEGVDVQEADGLLQQFLCVPSQNSTDFLRWICSRFDPDSCSSEMTSIRSKDPDVFFEEMCMLGQDLMLCKADEPDLIREGSDNFQKRLRFLDQLLTVLPSCRMSAAPEIDAEILLDELFALLDFSEILEPTLDPWPSNMTSQKDDNTSSKTNKQAVDVAMLLQQTRSALEQLRPECEFLNNEEHSSGIFSLSSLRVAACDLQQLKTTFRHVLETDLSGYCGRDPLTFSTEAIVFQRVHQGLQAFITVDEVPKERSEASMSEEVNQQSHPTRDGGEKQSFRK